MDQNGSFPGKTAGSGHDAVGLGQGAVASGQGAAARQTALSLSVYAADPAAARDVPSPVLVPSVPGSAVDPAVAVPGSARVCGTGHRDGLTGSLALQAVESLTQDQAGTVLARLDHLIRWAQAQQAKTLSRMQVLFRDEYLKDTGLLDPGLAFSLAAEEAAAILHVPTNTAMMLMSEAGTLCTTHTATLHTLESGQISYGHVQTVVDQSQNIPPAELPGFEARLLGLAPEQTHTQFRVRARRLRETTYPETIVVRQRSAFDRRRVALQPECDGMSWLSALLPAQKAQAFFHQLSLAARGEQAAGDPRTVDQLRADIMDSLLEGHNDPEDQEDSEEADGQIEAGGRGSHRTGSHSQGRTRARARARARTEILVLISAETLFGADDQPAELHGYGPISPVTARKMAREAAKWTPVERDPETGEFLRIGRKRKVPDRLKQVLRVRDGTCRFPGCRTNAVISEIDHTTPWAQGGATDHDNLEHLCRRHHMFKTKGFWKACQPSPGIIEWTSPGGRKYRTEPHLTLNSASVGPVGSVGAVGSSGGAGAVSSLGDVCEAGALKSANSVDSQGTASTAISTSDPDDYGDDPPPF
jgi:hypothetical protein